MTMEAKTCKWCGKVRSMHHGVNSLTINSSDGEWCWRDGYNQFSAKPSSPEPSGEEAFSELPYDLDAAHRLYCDVKNTDSNPEYARCLERLGELLRIEAAYKRGGGK